MISKETLSRKLGISTRTYYNWLHGKHSIPSDKLLEMSKIFNVKVDYLLEEREEKSE